MKYFLIILILLNISMDMAAAIAGQAYNPWYYVVGDIVIAMNSILFGVYVWKSR